LTTYVSCLGSEIISHVVDAISSTDSGEDSAFVDNIEAPHL